jgi:3-oxoacyl-[acyl-carrier protein] reductase
MRLQGAIALVTGGGTGLGRAITLALAREGVRVAVNYSRSESDARATVAEVEQMAGQAVAVRADVSDEADVRAMVAQVVERFGRLDVLVNNAGVTRYIPLKDVDAVRAEDFDRILAVNVKGAFLCAQAAAPYLRRDGNGKIVNVASTAGLAPEGSSVPYIVSKAGLIMLTTCLAKALAPDIQVNAVAPGYLETRWLGMYFPEDKQREILEDAALKPATLGRV